jgi:hypothetical protein
MKTFLRIVLWTLVAWGFVVSVGAPVAILMDLHAMRYAPRIPDSIHTHALAVGGFRSTPSWTAYVTPLFGTFVHGERGAFVAWVGVWLLFMAGMVIYARLVRPKP